MPNRLFRWANFLPPAPSGVNFKFISTCGSATIALDNDGYAWGGQTKGQFGDGTTTSYCVPTAMCNFPT